MAQVKEQSKTSERELNDEERVNLSDGEFKDLVIKMLTELVKFGQKMKKQMKDTQSEIRQNIRGTNSDRKETRTQSNNLEQKEEINVHPEGKEETRIQKNEERLRNLSDNLKCSNIWIIGVPEGEEQQQETENLFEQIMKENFPNLSKEIDFQEVQEAQRVPKNWTQRGTHQGTSSLSYPRLKAERKSYKQQEKRRQLPTKEFP